MQRKYLINSRTFFNFLLDQNSPKCQKIFLLNNLSKSQVQSIIEILYNLFLNKYIISTPSFHKIIESNLSIFTSKKYLLQNKFIRKHYQKIYVILTKAKNIILKKTK